MRKISLSTEIAHLYLSNSIILGPANREEKTDLDRAFGFAFVNNCGVPIVLHTYGVPEDSPKQEAGVMYEVVANPPADFEIMQPFQELVTVPPIIAIDQEEKKSSVKPESDQIPKGAWFHVGSTQIVPPNRTSCSVSP